MNVNTHRGGVNLRRRLMLKNGEEEDMDNWEQIIDYTTTEEDLNRIDLTVDDNGNSFCLKKAIISIRVMPIADTAINSTNIRLAFNGVDPWKNGNNLANSVKAGTANGCFCGYMRVEEICGKIHVVNAYNSFNSTTVTNCLKPNSIGYGAFMMALDSILPQLDGPIEQINIGGYTKVLGLGTHIKVLGVRQ